MPFSKILYRTYLTILLIIPIILIFLPANFFDEGQSICLSVLLFEKNCYACGMARAIQHLIHFNFDLALTDMTDSIIHRGPDDAGIWYDKSNGIGIGHRRLSILDLSSAGHQPMDSSNGRFVIAFNGEIYNFKKWIM